MFASSSKSVFIIQCTTIMLSLIGIFLFDFNLQNYLILLLGYFLYSGIGVSMMLHRYFSHRVFEFKSNILKWVCTWFALMAGRGSIIGWVYIHRVHHKAADTVNDPHYSSLSLWGMLFPDYSKFDKSVNLRVIKDLLKKEYINIDKYYNLLVLAWAVLLFLISPELCYFGWVLPVALTHIMFNSFLVIGHKFGYRNHDTDDSSTNFWPYAITLWGEGWHNNHHKNPGAWNLKEHQWEIDIVSYVIRLLKK
jgi:stearoyl-CoA desaturase (delta-9 desaturase)